MAIESQAIKQLHRIARIDGFAIRLAESHEQARAWRGSIAVFSGPNFRYASDSAESVRGYLHANTHKRTA